jgi:tetratricopeptide (TPR) repeat protein
MGLHYHALMHCRLTPLFASVLALCVSLAHAQPRPTPRTPAAPSNTGTSESINNSTLDAELFYQLLIGELNAISSLGGSPGTAYSVMLDAARKTNDAALYGRAVQMAIQGRAGEPALQAARAWKQAHPKSREANMQVLQVLLALNRAPETVEPLRTQISLTAAAERNALIAQVPRLYARVSDKKAAASLVEQALSEVLVQSDTSATAWTAVGRLRLAATDAPGALEAAKLAQAADTTAMAPALLALEIMDPKQPAAEEIVQRYLESKDALVEVRMGYARALLDSQRYPEASQQVQRVTQDQPDFPEAWLILGTLELQDNQIDKADASLKRYIDLSTQQRNSDDKQRNLTQAYLSLAQIAEKRKNFSLAESWLGKIDSPQALVSTQNRRASILAKQGKLTEARELVRKLPERNNGTGVEGTADKRVKLLSEVQLLRENKQYATAYELLEQAAKTDEQDHELLYNLAGLAEKMGRYSEMERLLRQLIAIKPDYYAAYNFLGYSLADRNLRLPEAKQLIQKALEFMPGDPYITDSLGWVEFRMGNRAEAIRLLEQAYKARPDAEIAAHLGEVYWVNGERDKARQMWKEGMLLNNENETLLETLKRLRVSL